MIIIFVAFVMTCVCMILFDIVAITDLIIMFIAFAMSLSIYANYLNTMRHRNELI